MCKKDFPLIEIPSYDLALLDLIKAVKNHHRHGRLIIGCQSADSGRRRRRGFLLLVLFFKYLQSLV